MIRYVRDTVTLLVIISGGVMLNWRELPHLVVGGGMLALACLFRACYRALARKVSGSRRQTPEATEFGHEALVGVLCGAAMTFVLFLVFRLALDVSAIVDLDRSATERKLARLEEEGRYEAANALITKRIRSPISDSFKASLQHRYVLIARLVESQELSTIVAKNAKDRHDAEFRRLCELGDAVASLSSKRRYYASGVAYAEKHGVDGTRARLGLEQVANQERKARPCDLPASTVVRILGVKEMAPIAVLHVTVCDSKGRHIPELKGKDFLAQSMSGARVPTMVGEATLTTEVPFTVGVAVDHSVSMHGEPQEQAKMAAAQFIKELQGRAKLRVYGFGSTVHEVTDISSLSSEGNTALYAAIDKARQYVAAAPDGYRIIVVITDGHNTAPGPSLDEVIMGCRNIGAKVHIVALRTSEIDETVLQRIAVETGGSLSVEYVAALSARLGALADTVARTPVYRLVVPIEALSSGGIRIQVGGRSSVAVSWSAKEHLKSRNASMLVGQADN